MRDILTDIEADILLSDEDPVKRAQNQMRAELPKRFYKEAAVAEIDGGFAVQLDGRTARTPGRALVVLPTKAAAQLVADEYEAQKEVINPLLMPTTRLVNTVIDGVSKETEAVAEDILRYCGTDLLCYRADGPERLVALQNEHWDPVLDWAATKMGARFVLAEGVVHVVQPPAAIQAVKHYLAPRMEPFHLGATHLMTSLTGSALLALAVEAGDISAETAWKDAHIDEDWQVEHWGQDSEAVARRNARWRDMDAAAKLIAAL